MLEKSIAKMLAHMPCAGHFPDNHLYLEKTTSAHMVESMLDTASRNGTTGCIVTSYKQIVVSLTLSL